MQQQMEQVQAQLAARAPSRATSGGGAVKVTAKNATAPYASVKIDPQALTPSDARCLEDMIVTAANQASARPGNSNAEMGKVTAGLNLPGLT